MTKISAQYSLLMKYDIKVFFLRYYLDAEHYVVSKYHAKFLKS